MRKIGPAKKRKSLYLCVAFILALLVLFPAVTPVHAVMDFDVETTLQILRSWLPLGPVGASREAPLFQAADHFVFDVVSSPQVAGQAFQVTITAKDVGENTVIDYVGSADLSDTTGSIAPTTTGAFTNGVWTGNVTITQAQTGVVITAADGVATGDSDSFDVQAGALNSFVFSTITSPQVAGQPFGVTVTAKDANGNTVTGYAGPAGLSDTTGTIAPTTTGAFTNGVWTGNVTITQAQTGVVVTAAGGGATGSSNSFTVQTGGLDHFDLSTITSPQVAGQPFGVTVTAKDASGNTVTGYAGPAGLSDTTGTIAPTTTGAFTNGVWTGNVTITQAQIGVTITAASGGATGNSNSFTVQTGGLDHFDLSTITSPQVAGQPFGVTVTAKDASGNTVTGYAGPAGLTDTTGTIAPTTTGAFTNGVWTGNVTITQAQIGVTITAASGGATGNSNSFTVQTGGLDHFDLSTITSPQVAGQPFGVTVTAKDASGNTVTGYAGPAGLTDTTGSIAPTTTGAFTNGVWTGNVTITQAQTGVVVTAASGGATGSSNSFTVQTGGLDHFDLSTITSPQVAGQPFGVTVTAKDASGNTVTGYAGPAGLSDTTGTIAPTTTGAFTNGVWTGNVTITQAQTGVVVTAAGGGATGSSNSFTVQTGGLDHFDLSTITSPQVAGQPFGVTVTAKDASGNTVTGYAGPAGLSDTTGTIAPTTTGAFTSGVWTGNVTITQAQTGVVVTAAGGGATGNSNSFTVQTGGLDHFDLSTVPSPQVAGQPFALTVLAKDINGNTVSGYSGIVSLSDTTGTMTPSTTDNLVNGEWIGNVTITLMQSVVKIVAADGGITGETNSFNVDHGPLAEVIIEDADGGHAGPVNAHAMTTDETLPAWAAGYDAHDNYIDVSVTWSGTGVVQGRLSPVFGSSTTFAPISAGTGLIHADDGFGHTDDTGQITVGTGDLDHIVIRDASNGGGGEVVAQALTIYDTLDVWAAGYDAENNHKADYNVSWSLTGDLTAGEVDPAFGKSTSVTPPSASGTGTVEASHSLSGLTAGSGLLTVQAPQLIISKTVVPEFVTAGQDLVYTLSYANNGDAAAHDVRVEETYDPNVSFVNSSPEPDNPPPGDANIWTRPTLDPGASFEIVVTVNVTDTLDPGAEVVNQVALSASGVDETTASATAVITGTPDLTVTVTSDPTPVNAGDVLTYHVKYENSGTARVQKAYLAMYYDGDLSFVSAAPPPFSGSDHIWDLGTVKAGEGGSIDVQVDVNGFMLDQASLVTYAVIWKEGDSSGFTDVENTLVNAPSLELIKTAEPDPAVADGKLVYTLVYSNVGHVEATALIITDGVPADTDFVSCEPSPCDHSGGVVTWDVDGLAPAESSTATLVVDVHANLDSGATLLNMARIHMVDTPDYAASAQVETSLISAPSLVLLMSNGKNNVRAGDKLVYILTYRNRGNAVAQDTTIVVTPPSPQIVKNVSCEPARDCELTGGQVVFDLGDLPAGAIGVVKMVVRVRDPLPAGARSITASAVINTTTEGDPPGGNEVEDTDHIVTRPDLVVTADYASEMPWPGKRVTYAVHYTNTGHIASTGVVISATQHPNTTFKPTSSDECWVHQVGGHYRCVVGNLNYSDSGERLFEVTLPSTPFTPETTDFDTSFTISDDGGSGKDENLDDNDFPAPLGVPDLVITKIVAQPSIWNGQPGFLWAVVKNRGTGRACGRYNPDGCTRFALDLFLNTETPPPSYPIEGYGDCYVMVEPIDSGLGATAVISFTTLSPALWPNQDGNGFCSAQTLFQIWAKADNWDPTQPPLPDDYGLVPETNEYNNVRGVEPGQDIFLPILIRND